MIKFFPESPIYQVGSNGKITCIVENDVTINEISWLKDDIELELNEKYELDKATLNILNVNMNDTGKYTCRILVDKMELSKTVNLKVIGIS